MDCPWEHRRAVDDPEIVEALMSMNYGNLIIQKGTGDYIPHRIMEDSTSKNRGLNIRCFDYVSSVADILDQSDLIICHAGAGSVFEGLQAKKLMIVVPNPRLMDNHQIELADRLQSMGHLLSSTTDDLLITIRSLPSFKPKSYQADNPMKLAQRIDALFEKDKRR